MAALYASQPELVIRRGGLFFNGALETTTFRRNVELARLGTA
jgi:hypothetical protein